MTTRRVSIIGFSEGSREGRIFQAQDPRGGEKLPDEFFCAMAEDINRAATLADRCFHLFGHLPGGERSPFLRKIAHLLDDRVDGLVECATTETALPESRIRAETARTSAQLRMFAEMLEDGSWVDARIDTAIPDRKPLPKPDLRSLNRPLGPVAMFGASNFPIAFSVAGGDTASAFAAGCPVVAKAHPAHPATSALAGQIIREAAEATGMPDGVFSLLFDDGTEVGSKLVRHPCIQAVGFTGSRAAGRAIMDEVAKREVPIPVYAEMSSVNPVFLLESAVTQKTGEVAAGICASLTLGVGQFCTCPGLVVLPADTIGSGFVEILMRRLAEVPAATMLHPGIFRAYDKALERRASIRGVEKLIYPDSLPINQARPALFRTSARTFLDQPELMQEIFGPAALLVETASHDEMMMVAESLEGQLTASVFGTERELLQLRFLNNILERKAGRLIFNQYPTGVEVCPAMVHGGPYPATSDGRKTSVGTAAVFRFTRRIAYQNWPQDLLPQALQDGNPLGISRMTNGKWSLA